MISRYFQNLWRELNDFLSSTSVHGLPYIHRSQSGTTRVIWTVLVAGALITATVLLVQTVGDWDTKYITTTLGKWSFNSPRQKSGLVQTF